MIVEPSISFGIIGLVVGVLSSHATLGNKIAKALTALESVGERVKRLEGIQDKETESGRLFVHRRASDA